MCQGSRKETGYKICPVQFAAPPVFYGRMNSFFRLALPSSTLPPFDTNQHKVSVAAAKQMEMVAFKLEPVHTEWYRAEFFVHRGPIHLSFDAHIRFRYGAGIFVEWNSSPWQY